LVRLAAAGRDWWLLGWSGWVVAVGLDDVAEQFGELLRGRFIVLGTVLRAGRVRGAWGRGGGVRGRGSAGGWLGYRQHVGIVARGVDGSFGSPRRYPVGGCRRQLGCGSDVDECFGFGWVAHDDDRSALAERLDVVRVDHELVDRTEAADA